VHLETMKEQWPFVQLNLISCVGDFFKKCPAVIEPFTR